MKRAKHEYLIGWKGAKQCVYGHNSDGHLVWVDRLTLRQAKETLATFSGPGTTAIYRLVEVKP